MLIIRTIKKIRKIIAKEKSKNKTIGFVPTMGALHAGHLSLVSAAKKDTDFVAVSIFINPTQFAASEDYKQYPRNFKKDEQILRKEGVNLVFYPAPSQMYVRNSSIWVVEKSLSRYLCGKSRPLHFRGVCTVVAKLFNIIQPDIAYFGQKDFQQVQIIKRLARDLNFPIKIKVMPIVREKSGLAVSSRNNYFSIEQRKQALYLCQALKLAARKIKKGEKRPAKIIESMINLIKKKIPLAKIDYINIVNPITLKDIKIINGKVLIALAVYVGKTRLIDNTLIGGK